MTRVTSGFVRLRTCFSMSPISVVLFEHRFIFQIALMSVYGDLEHFWLNSKTSLRVQLSKCEFDDTVIQTGNRYMFVKGVHSANLYTNNWHAVYKSSLLKVLTVFQIAM